MPRMACSGVSGARDTGSPRRPERLTDAFFTGFLGIWATIMGRVRAFLYPRVYTHACVDPAESDQRESNPQGIGSGMDSRIPVHSRCTAFASFAMVGKRCRKGAALEA